MVNRVGAHALLKAAMLHCPQTMDRVIQGLRKCRAEKVWGASPFYPVFLCTGEAQFSSVAHSCPTLCDPMYYSTPGFPVHHQLTSIESVMPSHHLILWLQLPEPGCPRACALQQEKPPQGEAHTLQLEQSPHSSEDPSTTENEGKKP